MSNDTNPQKVDSTMKKKEIPLKSIVSDFQQQFQNQMEIFNQFLNQKLTEMVIENAKTHSILREEARILREEARNTVSKAVLYTVSPPKPDGSPQLEIESGSSIEIESGGSTETKPGIRNKGESDLDQYSDFKSNNIRVTASLDNGRGEEKENSEKVQPIEKKRELVVGEGSSDYLFDLGGYYSTKQRSADSPESGELGWHPDPGPDPPDRNFSIPLVDSSSDSSTSLGSNDEDGENWADLEVQGSPIFETEKTNRAQVWPNLQLVAQDRPVATRHRHLLNPSAHNTISVSENHFLEHPGNKSVKGSNSGYGCSKNKNADCEGSENWELIATQADWHRLRPETVSVFYFSNPVSSLPGSLYQYLGNCITSNGPGLFGRWICHPLKDAKEINLRLNVVEELTAPAESMAVIATYRRKLPELDVATKSNGTSPLSLAEEIGGSPNFKIDPVLQRIGGLLSWDEGNLKDTGSFYSKEKISNESGLTVDEQNYSGSRKMQGGANNYAIESYPLKHDAEVSIPVTLKAWLLGLDPDIADKSASLNAMRQAKDGNSPMRVIHYAGPIESNGKPPTSGGVGPPSLNICVLQGLSFMDAPLLSVEVSGHIDKEKKFASSEEYIVTGDAAIIIKELITGPKVGLVSLTSPKPVVTDSIEGRSTLHRYLKFVRKKNVEYVHKKLGFSVNVSGTTTKAVMDMILITRYFDTLKENQVASKSLAIIIPQGAGLSSGEDYLVHKLTKVEMNVTLAWTRKGCMVVMHSMIGNHRIWSFYEVAMELNREDLASVAAEWGYVTWQHLFLYSFYPP